MHSSPASCGALRRIATALALVLFAAAAAVAQPTATSTLTGRVQNKAAGLALENARVTIAGTSREAFTDAFGEYRLTGLPPGNVTLTVFSTGLAPQTVTVSLAAGETVQRDFALLSADKPTVASAGDAVKLDAFVVGTARETNAATIAINEQRFAAGIKTVLATDALGDVIQNNLGEFVKFLPGVDVGTDQMNSVQIGLRGLPSAYTNIALDGDDVNAAGSGNPTRNTLLQAFSLSNAQRVEIYKVPTPDMPASLAGGINMVSRTAFEASRPELRFKVYVNQNSHEFNFRRMSGAGDGDDQKMTYHYQPDFDFAYTVPVSKTFGFSINATKNDQFGSARRINRNFSTATTPASNPPPDPLRATVDNPYLTSLVYNVFPVYEHRYAIGTRFDWKATPVDVLSFSTSSNWLVQDYEQHNFTINAGTNPFSWSDNFTHGRTGAGAAQVANTARYVRVRNNVFRLNWRHTGSLWDFTGSAGYNFSDQTYRAISHRQFETASGRIQAATVDFDGYSQYLPGKITVRNAAGQVVDPFDLNNYTFFLNGGNGTRDNDSTAKSARFDAKRKFFNERVPFSLKIGGSSAETYRAARNSSFNPVYVGPDGVTAANAPDESFTRTPFSLLNQAMLSFPEPRGLQQVQFPSGRRAWQLYETNPTWFNTQTNLRTDIRTTLTSPIQITERQDALFLMGDFSFFRNRLRVVTGVRYERTTDKGRAVLQDNNARYRKDAAGNLILDANRRPILIYAANTINTTTPEGIANGIAEDALVYQKLGATLSKQYGGYYPSLNATYNFTENVQARLGLAQAVGRPDFGNILGSTTVNQVDFNPESNATGAALGTITTKNPALKPWTANSGDVRLEYYPSNGAVLSAGFYRRQITNTFSTQNFLATEDFLRTLDLGEEFVGYQVNAPVNVPGITHINGWEFDVNAPLSMFTQLGFARSIRVFANATLVRNRSPAEADFRGFTPKLINWGVNYNRRPLSLYAKWTLVGKKRVGTIAAGNIGAAGWNYQAERLRLDLSGDYRLNARYGLYFTVRNLFNNRDQNYAYAIGSPRYVKFASEGEYGVNFQFGIKGNF
ncbi:MAG: TonB-dependent receptor [Verrucomicrobia bacterium]|nr:TonB-dependent receptor [Verrucomicrobiota bacterium]